MIVYGEELRPWLEQALGEKVPNAQFMGWTVNGEVVSVVGFHSYYGDDVELSAAAIRGSPAYLQAIFDYVFVQLECRRCTVRVRADNKRSLKLVRRLKFVKEGRMRKARSGHDLLIFGLLKEEYEHGWRLSKSSNPD